MYQPYYGESKAADLAYCEWKVREFEAQFNRVEHDCNPAALCVALNGKYEWRRRLEEIKRQK